jgi:DNA-directed RNA polymerase specialized sigma24 family protein
VAFTYAAKRRRQSGREQPVASLLGDPTTQLDHRHLVLVECVRRLAPLDRNIVVLYLEGLSAAEIEEVTGLSANSIAVRLTRLRHKLALALQTKEVRK